MSRLVRILERLSGTTGLVGASLVVPLFCIMAYEVVLRFAFDLPTFWAYELAYMLTGAHFVLGIGFVMRERRHIRIDFLYARFSAKWQTVIDGTINAFFLLPLACWMTWTLRGVAVEAVVRGEVSGESAWNPVVWPLRATLAFGFAVFTLQILADVIKAVRSLLGRGEYAAPK